MRTLLLAIFILFNLLCPVTAQKNIGFLKPERIYLHTDRNIYVAGEYIFYTMYFKGYNGQMSKYAYLLLRDEKNSMITHVRLEIKNQISSGTVFLPDTLNSGFYQIVCYTNLMRNAEDTYFTKEIIIANRFDEKLTQFTDLVRKPESDTSENDSPAYLTSNETLIIHPDKQIYSPREKITFSVEPAGLSGNEIKSLSISVSEIIPGIPVEPTISDYFGNNSENFSSPGSVQDQCKYKPEINGAVLQGRIKTIPRAGYDPEPLFKNAPAGKKNYTILLSSADSTANLQYTRTDSLGGFGFLINPCYEGKDLIIRIKEKVNATIELDYKTSLNKSFFPSRAYNVPGIKNCLLRSGKIVQIQKYYNNNAAIDTQIVIRLSETIPGVYYKSYSTIYPSDYTDLPDFVEISREILPAFKVRKINDEYVSDFSNLQYQSDTDEESTIFLDGVPIDDVNQIISLGTKEIKRIEILPVVRFYGEMSFNGILAVFSKNQAISNVHFKTPAINYQALSNQFLTKPKPFRPENIMQHHPDLRQVLLWEPEFLPVKDHNQIIECYASDLKGKYRINIQGVKSNGDPVNGSAIITIK